MNDEEEISRFVANSKKCQKPQKSESEVQSETKQESETVRPKRKRSEESEDIEILRAKARTYCATSAERESIRKFKMDKLQAFIEEKKFCESKDTSEKVIHGVPFCLGCRVLRSGISRRRICHARNQK